MKYFKVILFLIFSYFLLIPEGEARKHSSRHSHVAAKKKVHRVSHQKRVQKTHRVKKKAVIAKKTPPRKVIKPQRQQKRVIVAQKKKRQVPARTSRQRQRQTVALKKNQPRKLIVAKRRVSPPLRPKKQTSPKQESYLSLLNPQTQKNAMIGGLAPLLAKNYCGHGATIALIEYSGTWTEIKNAINGTYGYLSDKHKANYKRNLLPPIGGKKLHPDADTDGVNFFENKNDAHGSRLSSLLMDLAPQAKVLPVSTYRSKGHSYDVAGALLNLAKRPDIPIINISAGDIDRELKSQIEYDQNGKRTRKVKWIFPPKYMDAFKAVARAGKVIMIAAGNEGEDLPRDEFFEELKDFDTQLMGHLIENLDSATLESVVFAGNLDPDTRTRNKTSNTPGSWKKAQDRFLFAPGRHKNSYSSIVGDGTSNSAPYICAAIANILSKPGNKWAPKRVLKALLDSAEKRDVRTYGRGIIRADKALELLEKGF